MKPAVRRLVDAENAGLDRRSFFKTLGVSAGAAGALACRAARRAAAEAAAAFVQSNVKRASEPSALKITDLRVAVIDKAPMTCPIIRIDTNQGISGYGEVRDGASETYALFLKSRILGENPCNVDRIFRKIKQFGGPARQAGGVCGIEMACMDLAGKAWGVPCWQMLGGKFRDRVRLYADTTETDDPKEQGQRLKDADGSRAHVPEAGLRHRPAEGQAGHAEHARGRGARRRRRASCIRSPASRSPTRASRSCRTGSGRSVRSIGMDVPLASDHYGHISVNSCIKLARAMEKWNLAWMEDMVPWQFRHLLKQIRDATTIADADG